MGKLFGSLIVFFVGLALLAGCVDQELIARYEAEKAQALAVQAQAQANQAQAEAVKAQAEAMSAAARAQAEALAAQNRLYMVALIGVMIWSVAMVLLLVFVILQLVKRQQEHQVVYLPGIENREALQPGAELVTWPTRTISRQRQYSERGQ